MNDVEKIVKLELLVGIWLVICDEDEVFLDDYEYDY